MEDKTIVDNRELAQEMLNFLEQTNQYQNFLNWVVDKGYDANQLELAFEELED